MRLEDNAMTATSR